MWLYFQYHDDKVSSLIVMHFVWLAGSAGSPLTDPWPLSHYIIYILLSGLDKTDRQAFGHALPVLFSSPGMTCVDITQAETYILISSLYLKHPSSHVV